MLFQLFGIFYLERSDKRVWGVPGQYFDQETGLHYNYFRDYDPSTGRYVESDPIGLEGELNTYLYAASNPVLHIDPLGLKCCSTVVDMECVLAANEKFRKCIGPEFKDQPPGSDRKPSRIQPTAPHLDLHGTVTGRLGVPGGASLVGV